MDDMTAFERQLASGLDRMGGPGRRIDAMAVARTVTTTSGRWSVITRRLRSGFPAPTEGSLTMFSAVKFVVAGVIVALFGGFLLAGILTTPRDGEVLPAAVSASPTAETEPPDSTQPPESPPSPLTTEVLMSGMVTEEVEPGVYRVMSDGEGELDLRLGGGLVSGGDGSIWLFEGYTFYRLGSHLDGGGNEVRWHAEADDPDSHDFGGFEVAPDGTFWTTWDCGLPDGETERGSCVYSHNTGSVAARTSESGWKRHSEGRLEKVTSDGKVWVSRDDSDNSEVLGYLGVDGWQPVAERPYFSALRFSDKGEVWAFGLAPPPLRLVDGAWQETDMVDLSIAVPVEVGPDGTVWGISVDDNDSADGLVRFDGSRWQEWEPPDWLAPDHHDWRWDGDAWVEATEYTDDGPHAQVMSGDLRVAPDGGAWVISRLGTWRDQPVCTDDIDGVARFDGETWSRFLRDRCVQSMEIADDGSVLLLATESDARYPSLHVYIITPEAMAATE